MSRSFSQLLGAVRITSARSSLARVIVCAVAALAFCVDLRAQSVWFVDATATPPGQGTTTSPYATIQHAIDAVSTVSGDTLSVAAGTYHEAITYRSKALQIVGAGAAVTTIDATGRNSAAVLITAGQTSATVLAGFTIRGGSGNATSGGYGLGQGGGVLVVGASPTLQDLVIRDNNASHGGGIQLYNNANATIRRCVIHSNHAQPDGGGIYVRGCHAPVIEDCVVRDNTSSTWGGGFYLSDDVDAIITRTVVAGNASGTGGAFILQSDCDPILTNVTIANNSASSGAGFFMYHAGWAPSDPILRNCIVWNNLPTEVTIWGGAPSGSLSGTYTDFRGGLSGIGNINTDPLFVNPAARDYSLAVGSPCINAGDPSSPPDLDGSRADMGALPHFVQIQTYCTPGTSTNGCRARISSIGTPSASAGSGFILVATQVEGQRMGYLYYSVTGAQATPWGPSSSILCVAPPRQRMAVNSPTGGTAGYCDGVVAQDWNAFIANHPNAIGQPFTAGQHVWAQAYYRDPPAPGTTNLSDAVHFFLSP